MNEIPKLDLIGCWKFWGKFRLCPHAQTFFLHKVKASFRCPWEIINVFFSCNFFTFFLYIWVETEIPVWCFSRIQAFTSYSTSTHIGGFPHIAFCPGIWRNFASCCLHNWMTLSGGGSPKCLSAALLTCFLAYLITFSLKLAVYKNYFDIFQGIFQKFLLSEVYEGKCCAVHPMVIKSVSPVLSTG